MVCGFREDWEFSAAKFFHSLYSGRGLWKKRRKMFWNRLMIELKSLTVNCVLIQKYRTTEDWVENLTVNCVLIQKYPFNSVSKLFATFSNKSKIHLHYIYNILKHTTWKFFTRRVIKDITWKPFENRHLKTVIWKTSFEKRHLKSVIWKTSLKSPT
jgi:hypothetical protein